MNGTIELIQNPASAQRAMTGRSTAAGETRREARGSVHDLDREARAMFGVADREVPLPNVMRFLAGKSRLMALAEKRRAQQLVPVPITA